VGLTRGLGADPRHAAVVTVALVGLLRVGSVRYGLRTRAARGFVQSPAPAPIPSLERPDDTPDGRRP
jgi:hypothetical protein